MFKELKDLIFGLGEYEKVKIEVRIDDAKQLSSKLKVRNKIEFEILEDVVSKLKEQLRIKSSNLNCVIRDQKRKLTRKDIDSLLEELNKIKYQFLDIAERHIDEETPQEEEPTIETKDVEEEILEEPIEEDNSVQEEYKEVNQVSPQHPTKKNEEDSLDALLQEVQNKRKEVHTQKAQDDPVEKVQVEEEKPIVEHKEQEATIQNEPIEIETSQSDEKYIIYQDQKLIAYLKTNSKVPGEIIVEPNSKSNLNGLNEEDLSYIVAFSKIFASVAFETLEAHGTNIHWNYKDNQVHILPRYQNDEINVAWTPITLSETQFEEIKEKLMADMLKEIPKEEKKPVQEKQEIKQTPKEIVEPEVVNPKQTQMSNEGDFSAKADEILAALKKIP